MTVTGKAQAEGEAEGTMSSVEHGTLETSGKCPVEHGALPQRKTARHVEDSLHPIERDAEGVWQVYGFAEARNILRNSSATKQAGFNAEQIAKIPGLLNRPILYMEGKDHHQQRKQTARFFTPKTVSTNYRQFIERLAAQFVAELQRKKRLDLSQLSLASAVQVVSQVVGLTHSRLPGLAKRLDAFFQQGTVSQKRQRKPLLTWKWLGILRQMFHQRHTLAFYWLDVQPAIQAHKKEPREDVISHLLSQNYNAAEILTECITYAAAGMATTREFISVAAWHFLEHPTLRERYLAAPEEERLEMLHETLRLEPVVGNLYRRATEDIVLESAGQQVIIPEGDLINIHIYATNADETVVGEEPLALCPGRTISGTNIPSMLMAFGDGHHRCPGSYLAIQETDIFLQQLLALKTLHMEQPPTLNWNDLTAGYEIRNFMVAVD